MNKIIFIKDKTFKQFRNTNYYCSNTGEVYSEKSQKLLKLLVRGCGWKSYYYVDINFGNGQKHVPVHRMVYETWVGEIPSGLFVCHKNDNSFDNRVDNLYVGDQKQHIADCVKNGHRVSGVWILTVYDIEKSTTLTFCPANKFIPYSGHTQQNGGVNRMMSRNWFKKRFKVISYYKCKNLSEKESVTTRSDECNSVDRILSPIEVHGTEKSVKR